MGMFNNREDEEGMYPEASERPKEVEEAKAADEHYTKMWEGATTQAELDRYARNRAAFEVERERIAANAFMIDWTGVFGTLPPSETKKTEGETK